MNTEQFFNFLRATLSVNPDVLESEVIYVEVEVTHGDHTYLQTYPAVHVKLANGDSYVIGGQKLPDTLRVALNL